MLKRLIIIGIILLNLNGCAVIAVGAAATVVGVTAAVVTDPRSSGVVLDDNTIATKLQMKYSSDYPNDNIYVTSYNKVILLTGQIANEKSKESIEFEAKATPGVKKIYNYLAVRLSSSFGARSNDTLTTSQVKTKIIGLEGVSSNDIKVVTTENVVYILGVVTQSQARKIADAAAGVNGVSKVVTLFDYK